MPVRLVPCSGCARHVRVIDRECPFCGCSIDVTPAAPLPSLRGLGRAALVALGTSLAGGAMACGARGGLDVGEPPIADAGQDASDRDAGRRDAGSDAGFDAGFDAGEVVIPAYGTPPVPEDAGMDAGFVNLYGAPPPPIDDAGTDADAGGFMTHYGAPPPPEPEDAGSDADAGSVQALYGGSPAV